MEYKKEWLFQGPSIDELVAKISDDRKNKNKIAIILPSFRNNSVTEKHLDYLDKQTFKDFDVIIVYGPDDQFVTKKTGNLLHVRTSLDIGSAGSFYLGEKIALDEGYEYLIITDGDCYPVDKNVVNELISAQQANEEEKIILPLTIVPSEEFINRLIPYYGCIRASTFKKMGLSWMPFFYSGEEAEIETRLKNYKRVLIDSTVQHHSRQMYFFTERNYYNLKNCLIGELTYKNRYRFVKYFFIDTFMALAFAIIEPKNVKMFFRPVIGAIAKKMFKGDYPPWEKTELPSVIPEDGIDLRNKTRVEFATALKKLNITMLNKKIISDRAGLTGALAILLYILSKEFYVTDRDDGRILFYGKTALWRKIIFIILLPIVILLSIIVTVPISAYLILTYPFSSERNIGYGIE